MKFSQRTKKYDRKRHVDNFPMYNSTFIVFYLVDLSLCNYCRQVLSVCTVRCYPNTLTLIFRTIRFSDSKSEKQNYVVLYWIDLIMCLWVFLFVTNRFTFLVLSPLLDDTIRFLSWHCFRNPVSIVHENSLTHLNWSTKFKDDFVHSLLKDL